MAQNFGFDLPRGDKKAEVPFQFHNGFIVIEVLFNNIFPMKFIFDTGAEYTILTKKDVAIKLGVNYSRKYKIIGSDMTTELVAYLVRGISIKTNNLIAESQDILVLEEDYYRLDEFTGVNIQGIIGANFFRNLIFEINYRRQTITFYMPDGFSPKDHKGFTPFDISVKKGKPYLDCELEVIPGEKMTAKFLMDTGASLGLLLHTDTSGVLKMPEEVIAGEIGSGLGGQLSGFMGRVNQVKLQEFQFDGLIATFQEINPQLDTSFLNGRNGIIGNYLMNRFTLIFDYPHNRMYWRPRPNYNKGFYYDRSGLTLIASGPFLNQYLVQNVLEGSPAKEAGIQRGDRILSVNRWSSRFFDLTHLNKKFQKKPGKKIHLKIVRQGEKKHFFFELRDLI